MVFPYDLFINKYSQNLSDLVLVFSVSFSRVMLTINSSRNFVDMKRFIEVRWKIAHLVLLVLMNRLFALNQVEMRFSSLFICWNSSPIFSSKANKFVSAANINFLNLDVRLKSFTKIKKSNGPSINRCQTPQSISSRYLMPLVFSIYSFLSKR